MASNRVGAAIIDERRLTYEEADELGVIKAGFDRVIERAAELFGVVHQVTVEYERTNSLLLELNAVLDGVDFVLVPLKPPRAKARGSRSPVAVQPEVAAATV